MYQLALGLPLQECEYHPHQLCLSNVYFGKYTITLEKLLFKYVLHAQEVIIDVPFLMELISSSRP